MPARFLLLSISMLIGCFDSVALAQKPGLPNPPVAAELPCEASDLYSDERSPLRNIPIRDQDGSGTCYAEAAATLANHQLMKTKQFSTPVVHPVYLGSLNAATEHADTSKTGSTWKVLEQLQKFGFCDSATVERQLSEIKKAGKFSTTSELFGFLESVFAADSDEQVEAFSRAHPTCDLKAATNWLASHDVLRGTQLAFSKEAFGKCPRLRPKLPTHSFTHGTEAEMIKYIDNSLRKASPVSATFNCFEDFSVEPKGPSSVSVEIGQSGRVIRLSKSCSFGKPSRHSTVIAGQRLNGGACEYLVRNSWGSKWRGDGASACACETKNGQYKQSCSEAEAKVVLGCWYDRSSVLKNTVIVNAY